MLLGSPRELTAQATKRPPDLYSKYEFHFTLLSSLSSVELTAQGAERPLGLLLRVRVPPHAPGRFASIFKELHGTRRPKSTGLLHRCPLARSSKTVFMEAWLRCMRVLSHALSLVPESAPGLLLHERLVSVA